MNPEVKQFLNEAAAMGRIKAMLDIVVVGLGKGLKRSSDERRALWATIASEATACRDAIPAGTKPRAPKAAKTVPEQTTIKAMP